MAAPHAARAQSNDLLNRLDRIENEVDTLNRAVYKGEKPPASASSESGVSGDAAANIEMRLGKIESDMRDLTGKVEKLEYDNQQNAQKLDALANETKARLDAVDARLNNAPAAGTAPAQPGASASESAAAPAPLAAGDTDAPPGIPDALKPAPKADDTAITGDEIGATDAASLYEQGFAAIKKEDYAGAEKNFSSFLKQYPSHALAPNAMYWLGETYYARKDYDKASRTFAEAYQKYPKGPKAADNLLKLGMSLAGKGEKDNACIALGQLKKEYPNGPAPVLKRGDEEMATLGCQ